MNGDLYTKKNIESNIKKRISSLPLKVKSFLKTLDNLGDTYLSGEFILDAFDSDVLPTDEQISIEIMIEVFFYKRFEDLLKSYAISIGENPKEEREPKYIYDFNLEGINISLMDFQDVEIINEELSQSSDYHVLNSTSDIYIDCVSLSIDSFLYNYSLDIFLNGDAINAFEIKEISVYGINELDILSQVNSGRILRLGKKYGMSICRDLQDYIDVFLEEDMKGSYNGYV